MEALKLDPVYTIEDILALPDGERAELIDGKIYYMASPTRTHQELLGDLFATIYNHIKASGKPCKVYPAPFAVYLKKDNSTYVEPDISVVCDLDKLENDKGCVGAPDWIIEIVSPSSASHDYFRKLHLYQVSGVREYWLVDPENHSVMVYYLAGDDYRPKQYSFNDKINANIWDDLTLDFGEFRID